MSGHQHVHDHKATESSPMKQWLPAILSSILLLSGIVLDGLTNTSWFSGLVRFTWYGVAYLPVGIPVLFKGIRFAFRGDLFTEFFLMSIATLGAFYLGEYPEGVAVMLFYSVGELFQDAAVNRSKRSIKALLDVRPESALVLRQGNYQQVNPSTVKIEETIQVKVGERVPLDGELLSDDGMFNSAALTGESVPTSLQKGDTVLAGMINEHRVVDIKVTKLFNDSSLARILTLVQNATGRKARTELFIRKFARVYTPIVVFLALGLTFIPYFFITHYDFEEGLYRALIFLVISCPCALVVAIPLGYFGGIGAGSRNGVLFKGSNYLDLMTRVDTVVMDKTGTLTKGIFKVQRVVDKGIPSSEWLPLVVALEAQSTHPVANAVVAHSGKTSMQAAESVEEIKGLGLKGVVQGKEVLAGNIKLLEKFGVVVDNEARAVTDTLIAVAVNKVFAGYMTIADEIKKDSLWTIKQLQEEGIETILLSGDKQVVVDKVAAELGISKAFGDLLPEQKLMKAEEIKSGRKATMAFVGDGINDAPVLAMSDVGIAMGGLGSDAAIETADVVIQTDQPSKVVTAIRIGKATNAIVWQNIGLAFGVKLIVLALGAGGIATLWEAVFADVGVALLAILNAVRIQRMKF